MLKQTQPAMLHYFMIGYQWHKLKNSKYEIEEMSTCFYKNQISDYGIFKDNFVS